MKTNTRHSMRQSVLILMDINCKRDLLRQVYIVETSVEREMTQKKKKRSDGKGSHILVAPRSEVEEFKSQPKDLNINNQE
ncbi:hypothetical protein ACTXT7_010171 [Hymenolepis weldensis]